MLCEKNKNNRIAARLTIFLLSFLMLVCGAFPVGMSAVYAENKTVSDWSELKNAVEKAANGDTITLSSNIVVDNNNPITVKNKITITTNTGDSKTVYQGKPDSKGKYQTMFTVQEGGNLTIDSGVTLSAKKIIDGSSGQCPDGTTGNPSSYTADEFTGGLNQDETDYQPKGFFIHVESRGTATLKGTVSDFVTSRSKADTPRYVAPVVADGDYASFNIDGGTIKNNLVGYIADDEIANTNASTIKQYVKGAGPNVPRKPNAQTQKANKDSFDRARNTDAGIDGGSPGTGLTGTAGAVIYKGGAKGEIKNNASITNNRADTGGIMVSGYGTSVTIGSDIDPENDETVFTKNVGVQFGGGSTVEQGGLITMQGGEMSGNVAWFGGGAVYATENGIAWLLGLMNGSDGLHPQFDSRLDGNFEMYGGKLDGNTALTRGGAILADSDGVQIIRGKLTNNMSRMLGGAVYVMGDHPKYTYTMHLEGLFVHDNTAVSGVTPGSKASENDKLQTRLSEPSPCGDGGDLLSGKLNNNTDDMNDGWGTHGTGGGVWLCAYGNTVLSAGATDKVVIADNYATGASPLENGVYPGWIKNTNNTDPVAVKIRADIAYNSGISTTSNSRKTGGSDIHADTGDEGTVVIDGLQTYSGWTDENTDSAYETEISDGRINLVNKGPAQVLQNPAVEVSGNIARRGGGLAADGTYILGPAGDQATVGANMRVAKEWSSETQKKPVMMRVTATAGSKKAHVADVPLDGVANPPANEFETIEELTPIVNTWNGRFSLPLSLIAEDNSKLSVFEFTLNYGGLFNNKSIDPMSFTGRKDIASLIKKVKEDNTTAGVVDNDAVIAALRNAIKVKFNNDLKFECTEYEMKETTDPETGVKSWQIDPVEVSSYIFTRKDINLDTVDFDLTSTPHYEKVWDEDKGEFVDKEVFQVHLFGVNLVLPVSNDNKPLTEKYVNNQVHSDIVNFDQEFKYDIMAYVPIDATEFEITDKLVEGLEFADKDGKKVNDRSTVEKIILKMTNDHKPLGTVAQKGVVDKQGDEFNFKNDDTVTVSGDTITVSIKENTVYKDKNNNEYNVLEYLRGHWVQVTFYARIKDDYRTIEGLRSLTNSWAGTELSKKGDPAYDVTIANGDPVLIKTLMDEIGPDDVVWAVEGPSRLFARTESGDYYATPMDDKTGNSWTGPLKKNSADWNNADNRFNGRGAEAANTVRQLDTEGADAGLVATLKNMPKVKGATVEKGAEGASRLFVQVTNINGETEYWATPYNDKSGAEWKKIDKDDASDSDWGKSAYDNAVARLKPDRYTIRMLNFNEVESIELSKNGMNWPVISQEEHDGMKNNAEYRVKIANQWSDKYKTNTVTVKPETTELDVRKVWKGLADNQWPVDSVTFGIYAVSRDNSMRPVYVDSNGKVVGDDAPQGSTPMTVTLTKDNPSATVSGLPRLKNTIYTARETKLVKGSKEYVVEYTNAKFDKTVNAKIISLNDSEQIEPSVTASYRGDFGQKFESLRDQVNKKIVRGATADDRLWGMALDGSYFVTAVGDTEGTGSWTKIDTPSDSETDETKIALYDRAVALLGSIDYSNGRMTKGTATGDGIKVEDIISVITATNTLGRFIDFEVTKKWTGVVANDIPSIEDFRPYLNLKLFDGENKDVTLQYADKLSITKRGTSYIAKWSGLPEGEYKAAEIEMPGFETVISEDGKTITNTKKPSGEEPEIEKYVNQAVHKDIKLDEVFTYDIIAYVTKDADSVTITDKLHDMLTFEGDTSDVSVVDLGEADNHLVTNNVSGVKVNDKATVAKEGKIIDGTAVSINDQVLTVFITNTLKKSDAVYDLVQIDFIDPSAKGYYEKDGDDYKLTKDSSPESRKTYYEKKETYEEVKDLAPGTDISGNGYYEQNGEAYVQTSDTEASENKKYYELVYTYEKITIDAVNPSAEGYYEKEGETYTLTEDNIADPNKEYYARDEESEGYEYDGDFQPVRDLRGHWIKVTFKARINDKTLEEVKKAYKDISASDAGNDPVISAENHTGIPNDASYTIGVANEAGMKEDVHRDKSNIVTVKPKDEGGITPKPDDGDDVAPADEDAGTVKSADTGDETPLGFAIFGLLGSAAAFELMRRRRMS